MKIYMVRHTSVNVPKGMCYGQTDVPLQASFEEEAESIKATIDRLTPDIIYSSPLSRCTKLASACGFNNPILDDRLMELNFGDWEGRIWDDVDMSVWKADWINIPAPHGESFMEMYERVTSLFEELNEKNKKSSLIFTHGGVITCARIYFNKIDIKEAFGQTPKYGEIVEFEYQND